MITFLTTTNNKVDELKLPAPKTTEPFVYKAPETPKQEIMVAIWMKVLAATEIGIQDNFFVLGGDSLKAIRLIAEINQKLESSLNISDLYTYQTIEELSSFILTETNDQHKVYYNQAEEILEKFEEEYKEKGLFKETYEAVYPMNGVEIGMVFHTLKGKSEEKNVHNIIYHEQNLYPLSSTNFDFTVFRKALDLLLKKHSVFRKIYDTENLVHIILKEVNPEVNYLDLSDYSRKEQEKIILDKKHEEKLRGTKLDFSLIWRMTIIKTSQSYHYLLFDFHHSLFGGWSLQSFRTELNNVYLQLLEEENHKPPFLKSTYRDQILGEIAAALDEESIDYWKKELDGYKRVQFQPTGMKHEFVTDEYDLGKEIRQELEKVASTHKTNFKHLCLAAYMYAMKMLSSTNDVTVGVVSNNRPLIPDGDKLLGCFLNTIPFRMVVPENITWSAYISYIEDKLRNFKRHEKVPFYKVLEITKEPASDRNPIFDTSFNYIDFYILNERVQEEITESTEKGVMLFDSSVNTNTPFDLHVEAINNGFKLFFTYSTAIMDKTLSNRIYGYFKAVLYNFVHNEVGVINQNDILGKEQKLRISNFNNTSKSFDTDKTLIALFAEQVIKTPEVVALVMEEERLTYRELDVRSDQWASCLVSRGVSKGDFIGLIMNRSTEMIIAILAALKSGMAYVPIAPNQPTERTKIILEEINSNFVISNMTEIPVELQTTYTFLTPKVLDTNSNSQVTLQLPSQDDVAYVIYTSGSTGVPKGVVVEHKNMTNFIHHEKEFLNIDGSDVILQFSPYYFDVSVQQIWLALTTGAQLVLVKEELLGEPEDFVNYIEHHNVTILNTTPSFLEGLEIPKMKSLKKIVVSGEECKPKLATRYLDDYDFYNEYGPTEATVIAIACKITKAMSKRKHLPIGTPISNTEAYILDEKLQVLPIGSIGELYLSGRSIAKGYLNRPELTKERFIKNPYGNGRLYKTGDLAKWNEDGTIDYMGRADQQIKLNGIRIEPGEIENQLCTHFTVTGCIVTVKEHHKEKVLIAYYTSEIDISETELKTYLLDKIPMSMIPRYFVQMASFQTTENGKLDRKALPEVIKKQVAYLPADTETEKQLFELWQEVLNCPDSGIGVTHSFFELGGNSLKAMVLINRINKGFSVKLLLRDIFQYQTIRSLGVYIVGLEEELFVSIPRAPKQVSYPLSSAQQRMYFLYEFDKESTTYNMPGAFELKGAVDISHLEGVFAKLITHHWSLRTTFELGSSGVVQRVKEDHQFSISVTAVSESEVDASINGFIRPFDLSNELPIRVGLLCVSTGAYLLLVDMHHIINDGVSMEVLLADFWRLYQGQELTPLALQYIDYALWQQSESYQSLVNEDKSYWQRLYEEEVSELLLPYDYPRPLYLNDTGLIYTATLSASQVSGLRKLSQDFGVTLSTLFLSLYNVLLHKLSRSEDIVVGTATTGRHHADLEGIVGMFVNTLALRNNVVASDSFTSIIARVHQTSIFSLEHQLYQYEDLIDMLGLERDTSRNPLFDVFYLYAEETAVSSYVSSDANIHPYNAKSQVRSKFDLSMNVSVSESSISIGFVAREDLFKSTTLVRFTTYLGMLIDQVVLDPGQSVRELTIVSVSERQLLLEEFNASEKPYDLSSTVLDMFAANVAANPEGIALIYNGESLSYGELDARSDKWSSYLGRQGVMKGSVVGLLMHRSTEMITAILSAFKLGCAYLPIDPDQPESRSLHMLSEMSSISNSRFVLSNVESVSQGIITNYEVIDVQKLDSYQGDLLAFEYPVSSDLAYIIYTSGSTGLPKGVLVEHRSVTNLINHERDFLSITSDERILQFSPYYFDVSVEQIWLSLTTGSSLVLIDKNILGERALFLDYLTDHKITMLNVTPSYLESLDLPDLPDLRRIVVSGEVCPPELADQYNSRYDFYNEYGPTEATVIAISEKVTRERSSRTRLSIGLPIANLQAYVLDEHLQLVPIGVVGELHLCGVGIARGYLNREELTAERFISNPYGEGKLYKTGDLAKWNSDETIAYLGRQDQQIKYNGVRIEPGEIESHICNLSEIKESVVTVKEVSGNESLVCYYVSDHAYTLEELQSYLSGHLPLSMIPQYYVQLPSLPTTSTGKLDRKALPEVIKKQVAYLPADTETEKQLFELWQEVLNCPDSGIGVTHSFFELGGNSLKAMVLINRINKEFSVKLLLRDIFQYQTIRSLGVYIVGLEEELFVSIPRAPKQVSYPLSSAQQRMYFLYEFDKESTTYNMPGAFELKGAVDISHLEGVFAKLITHHWSLRTTFELGSSGVVQRVIEDHQFSISVTAVSESEVDASINGFIRPFDLSNELPIRVGLLCVSTGAYLLLVDMHHIINDGVSMEVLLADFWRLYQGQELTPLALQYIDYALWQQSESYQSLVNEDKSYWQGLYEEEVSELLLPYDYPRPLYLNDTGLIYTATLSASQVSGLRKLSQDFGVTLSTLFLSLYNVLLHKLSGSEDIVVGTATAGRHHADLEGIVGMFVNTLALRNNVVASDSFTSIIARVHQTSIFSLEHQLYQYEDLIDMLGLERDTSRNPLFDVFYLYAEETAVSSYVSSDANIHPYNAKSQVRSKFDLSMNVSVSESSISIGFVAREDLFKSTTLVRFTTYLGMLIDQVVLDPGQSVRELTIVSVSERQLLLEEFNASEKPYDLSSTVLDMFAANVAANPEGIALIYNGESLSYGELDARSDKWSSYLGRQGVMKGSVVGLLMHRSTEMITAILSAFKLGCAYLPIDPDQPESRSLHMLSEMSSISNSRFVLSNVEPVSQGITTNYEVIDVQKLDSYQGDLLAFEYPVSSDLAYIIYTSGSTGLPKGVLVEHRSVTNLINHERDFLSITSDERILQFSPYYFDVSVEQIWLSLTTGSSLVLIDKNILGERALFLDYLTDHKITMLNVTPSYLESLDLPDLPDLRRIVVSGEVCPPELADQYNSRYDFYNEYGPTEATVIAISEKVTRERSSRTRLSIGLPIANLQAYVLDEHLQLVPIGVVGELHLCGVGIARGYLNREELTAERFISNPYGEGKLYKTGDLAKWHSDETIAYLGRQDQQIKYNGVRIEPGEIESHICNLSEIKESVVTVKEVSGNESLVCYYVSDQVYTLEELQSYLSGHLPLSMIPQYYVQLPSLPTTSTGKLDRKALPEVIKKQVAYLPADTETEKQLFELWQEVLNCPDSGIGVTHSFFELGGNSLKAMVLINRINKEFSVKLLLRDIFQYQTIRSLAGYISGLNPSIIELSDFIADDGAKKSLVLRLNTPKSQQPAIFCIPPILGSSTVFKNVAIQFENIANVYGLQYRGFDVEEPFDNDINQMATSFVQEIQKIAQPNQSILITGYSMGATIAYEVVKILEEQTPNIKLLLIDREVHENEEVALDESKIHDTIETKLMSWKKEMRAADFERIKRLVVHNAKILAAHKLEGNIKADVVAIEAVNNSYQANMKQWEQFTSGTFEHQYVTSNHYQILETQLAEVIKQLKQLLNNEQTNIKKDK